VPITPSETRHIRTHEDLNFAVGLAGRETVQDGLHGILVPRLGPGSLTSGSRPWKK
jgi:hypothetical protein